MVKIENQKKILVVDDEIYVRKIFKYNLEKAGYQVTAAEDSYEAEEKIAEGEEFDLIICDLMMPVRSGIEFIKVLREKYKMDEQRIILVSARGMEKDILEAKLYNIDDYQMKPFSVVEFLEKVKEILKKEL